jgi:hypothetical protein
MEQLRHKNTPLRKQEALSKNLAKIEKKITGGMGFF